jgi:hypothetical protein
MPFVSIFHFHILPFSLLLLERVNIATVDLRCELKLLGGRIGSTRDSEK